MIPVAEFVSGTESSAVGGGLRTNVDNGTVPVSDNLRLTVRKAPVFHLDANAMRDRLQLDIRRIRNSQLGEKLFGRTHRT
jgi:hypothetical protein